MRHLCLSRQGKNASAWQKRFLSPTDSDRQIWRGKNALTSAANMPYSARMEHQDLLSQVVAELERRTGDLRQLSQSAGLAYDTVLRIKNREGDPGYSKVRTLADHLGIKPEPIRRKRRAEA